MDPGQPRQEETTALLQPREHMERKKGMMYMCMYKQFWRVILLEYTYLIQLPHLLSLWETQNAQLRQDGNDCTDHLNSTR